MPNRFDIQVPSGAATLALQLRAASSGPEFELHLYDCTTGECFSDNFTLPAGPRQRLVVRRPRAGRWVAAVSAAPIPQAALPFELDEVVAMPPLPHAAETGSRRPAASWTDTRRLPRIAAAEPGTIRVLLVELIDPTVERNEAEHPWETRAVLPKLRDRPVAVGMSIHRLP